MGHSGKPPLTRHPGNATSRDTHSAGGFDPTVGGDRMYGQYMDLEQIGAWQIPPGGVNDGNIDPGGLDGDESITPGTLTYTPFADTVRPVGIVTVTATYSQMLLETGDGILLETGDGLTMDGFVEDPSAGLPALPDANYPEGAVIFCTADYKLYRNAADVWIRSTDGVDLVADSVTAGVIAAGAIGVTELSAEAVTTEKLAATAVIKLVTNDGSTVVIDADGIAVTDGAITVENAGAVVIIDGTSNMFKIVASGTFTHSQGTSSSGGTTTAISGSGLPNQSPAYLTWITEGTSPATNASRDLQSYQKIKFAAPEGYIASSSGGAVTSYILPFFVWYHTYSTTSGGDPAIVGYIDNADLANSYDLYVRYHLLKETAI